MSGPSTYEPQTGIERWLDSRLPIARLMWDSFVDFPTPRNLNYWWTFGGILAIFLMIQIITGVVLAMHYTADVNMAFDSVQRIRRDVPFGWLIQSMHANGASFFFLAVYIHIFRGMYYGSYKAPREVLWILGVVIYLLMMATGFLGYVLPWGQMSYWGAMVITNLFGALPVVGEGIREWLWGGFSVGNATLTRFYALHFLLPFVIAGVVILHIWALHIPGSTNPTGVEVKKESDTVPFHPYYTAKDGFGLGVFLIIYCLFVFFMPNALGHPDNYIEANPLSTPALIVPEWYFYPFYAILRAFTFDLILPAKLWGVLAMFAAILVWFFLPWLDKSPVRSARYRPLYRVFFWILMVDLAALFWLGGAHAEEPYIMFSQIAAAYYFLHFLVIVPVVSSIERPKPLPYSITEAVLGKDDDAQLDAVAAAKA